jgi:hypothetical protein
VTVAAAAADHEKTWDISNDNNALTSCDRRRLR